MRMQISAQRQQTTQGRCEACACFDERPAVHACMPQQATQEGCSHSARARLRMHQTQAWQLPVLQRALAAAVGDVSDELCGLAAAFEQVWFVQEAELLALALAGRYSVQASTRLACGQGPEQAAGDSSVG